MPSYYRDCKDCGQKIIMAEGPYSWQAMEPDGSGRHVHNSGVVAATQVRSVPSLPAEPTWDFDTLQTRVTYLTRCWIDECGDPVFFHRAENGGCVLFDNLEDRPWAVHHCWRELMEERKKALAHFRAELSDSGFDGQSHLISRPRQRFRSGQDVSVVVGGYVADNYALDDDVLNLFLRSARGVSSSALTYLDIADSGNKVFRFLFPADSALQISPYELVRVHGCWQKRGRRWILLASKVERRTSDANLVRKIRGIPDPKKRCCMYCGVAILNNEMWGLDCQFHIECARCGRMRGMLSGKEFVRHCRRIGKFKKSQGSKG